MVAHWPWRVTHRAGSPAPPPIGGRRSHTLHGHCGYSRYLLNQGTKTQYSGGKGGAASCPWLIPAGKLVSSHRAQGPPPQLGVGSLLSGGWGALPSFGR